jgi:hypothetical protein
MTRRLALILVTLSMAFMAVSPATAATALTPCAGGGLGFGTHESAVTPDPTPILGEAPYQFRIDLSDQVVAEGAEPVATADVTVVLSWDTPVSDYDMTVNGTDVWNNPVPPETSESIVLDNLKHCAYVDVNVWTYVGTPIDVVTLTLEVAQ